MDCDHKLRVTEDYESIVCDACTQTWDHIVAGFGDIFVSEQDGSWLTVAGLGVDAMGKPRLFLNAVKKAPTKGTKIPITEE